MTLPINVTCSHAKGHQDNYLEFDELDRMTQLNVLMGIDAKKLATAMSIGDITIVFHHDPHPFPMKILVAIIDQFNTTTYNIIADKLLIEFRVQKGRCSSEQLYNRPGESREDNGVSNTFHQEICYRMVLGMDRYWEKSKDT